MNIILIGASTANLYAAKKLKELGYVFTIFEKKNSVRNDQSRLLPSEFLKKIGYTDEDDGKSRYVKLTSLKQYLAKDIPIQFGSNVVVDYETGDVFIDNNRIDFDVAIVVTGHKKVLSKNKKIFTYDYTIDGSKNHYAGRSLITAIEKVDRIIKKLKIISQNP